MIFNSTTGLQVKAYGADANFKLACLKTSRDASSNLLRLETAGQNRLGTLLGFTDVNEYEYKLGIPMSLALTLDYVAIGYGAQRGTDWLLRLLEAIEPGVDLSYVFPQYLAWFLDDNVHGVIRFAERHGTGSAIRSVATALRAGTTDVLPVAQKTQGDRDIAQWQNLSRIEHVIARSKTSELESLDIAACVPDQSAAGYTIDSQAAGIAERVASLAKKLLLDGERTAERINERLSVSESQKKFSAESVAAPLFSWVDVISGSVASVELWTRIVILMQKTQELSLIAPNKSFSNAMHAEKLLALVLNK